ncbi:ABC transporter [Colletotrichum tofieldiae]|uniref:ABC transporter n=1 Tax=Colletotrichum tofieldiae TaxID=708197 RepID=A0A161YN10_9PEZI|nr:ABC transporter [Colletotrichum tofieldiae]
MASLEPQRSQSRGNERRIRTSDLMSFRMNLDPFAIATDVECQGVLETVQLWGLVRDQGGLGASMNADTLSQGQKQLFSLARVVLRKRVHMHQLPASAGDVCVASVRPVACIDDIELQATSKTLQGSHHGGLLILDEFSSSVDTETEQETQQIIWKEFEDYTILMISHRLDMVMKFDRVVILDSGKVVEHGVPRELVEKEGSWFKCLWTVGGEH